jgi:hypothetical protein
MYALKKQATGQICSLASGPVEWILSPPEGYVTVEVTDTSYVDGGLYGEEPSCTFGESGTITEKDGAIRAMTNAEIDAAGLLDLHRKYRMRLVNQRTAEIEAQGFEYPASSGHRYGMDDASRINVAQMNNDRNDAAMPWNQDPPVTQYYNAVDDSYALALEDADDVHAFYLAGLAAYSALKNAGNALKASLRAATTMAELDAIVDER